MAFDSSRQQLVVFGGRAGALALRDVWERGTGRWLERTEREAGPVGRSDLGLAFDSNRQRTVAFGGLNERGDALRELWEWDGTTWTARTTEQSGPSARAHVAMAYDRARGRTVVFGGAPAGSRGTRELWEWDGETWTDRTPADGTGPTARRDASMVFDAARSRVVVFGGRLDGVALGDSWEWDGTSWQAGPNGPAARFDASLGYDEVRQRTVLFGGTVAGADARDVWEYDGATWTERAPAPGPSARHGALAAFDGATARFVVHGGVSVRDGAPVVVKDTWAWDGASWTELPTRDAEPGYRSYPQHGYDAGRERAVMFGGLVVFEDLRIVNLDDTWEWDGDGWLERTPTTRPPGRCFGGFAYDSARGVSVMFGGGQTSDGASFTRFGDTWTWNGTTWTQHAVAGPPARMAPTMAYDAARQRVVLYGGATATTQLGDVWEWDGEGWLERTPANDVVGARALTSMAYDATSRHVVLYGGLDATSYGTDLWS